MATILVVDDSATDRILAGGLLTKQSDLEVVYAKNGEEALEQIDEHLPDAVVTDMQMPVMDGFKLVAEVKKRHPLIPIILMTAAGSEEIAVQALQEGASHYVPKRNLAQGLVRTVRRVLATSLENVNRNRLINRMTYREEEYVLEADYPILMALADQLPNNILQLRICQPSERVRLCVAIEEALSNAFYHGNMEIDSKLRTEDFPACEELLQKRLNDPQFRDRKIVVKVRYTPEQVTIVIRDEGKGFDLATIPNAQGEAD
ncbi:MAG: response regulator [Planctomycetales bacterium]